MNKYVLLPVLAVSLVAVLGVPALSWMARKMLFPAPMGTGPSPVQGRSDVVVADLPSKTEAWYLPPHNDSQKREGRAPVFVYTHGNGELIDHWLDDFELARGWGVGVLLVEYPGYGRSPGSPSEASIERTMVEAHDFLSGRTDVDPDRLIAFGRSLGGGAAALLANQRPVAAMILESTFTSVRQIGQDMGAPAFIIRDPFDNLSVVRGFEGPILGVHGTKDDIIPYAHAQELAQAGRDYELVTLPCGHNDCVRQWDKIHEFVTKKGLLTGSKRP